MGTRGYCLDKVSLHGSVHVIHVNGAPVGWKVFIKAIRLQGCFDKNIGNALTVRNEIGSEYRSFKLSNTFVCQTECDVDEGCGGYNVETVTLSRRGTGPLPDEYRALYDYLEFHSIMVGDKRYRPQTPEPNMKETDPFVLKSAIILALLPIPELSSYLSSANQCLDANKACRICPEELQLL